MEDVSFESDDLLDEQQVIKYLSAVAPVPYANYFIFSSKIKEFAKEIVLELMNIMFPLMEINFLNHIELYYMRDIVMMIKKNMIKYMM